MDILVYGGTFDPPHVGHLKLLKAGFRAASPSEILLVPAWRPPLKGEPAASPAERTRMLELALDELPAKLRRRARIDRLELHRRRRVYTHQYLADLRRRRPRAKVGLLLGSDNLLSFPKWRRWREVLRKAELIVGRRPGFPKSRAPKLKARWLAGVFPDVASTELRRRIALGDRLLKSIPEPVMRFARERSLYGLGLHRWLRARLKKNRYAHVLAVARNAVELARIHGLDPDAARTAALLHDAGRSVDSARLPAYARRHRLEVPCLDGIVRHRPMLLHAHAGAHIARTRFGVRDRGVLRAIESHTLGRAGMSPLEKLIYVADASSKDRKFHEAGALRRLARKDLDAALRETVRRKLLFSLSKGGWLHPNGIELWNETQS